MKRRVILLLVAMVVALAMASGAALAADPAKEKTAQGKSALGAPDAKAKKEHHNSTNTTVDCPNQPDNRTCLGTSDNDLLVGGEEFDQIEGGEGDDTYDGKGGGDDLFDASKTSNDLYLIPAAEFDSDITGGINIVDLGGNSDVLDLSAYKSTDFALARFRNLLTMQGPGKRTIGISFFFKRNTIDTFKFSDVTLTAKQIKHKVHPI